LARPATGSWSAPLLRPHPRLLTAAVAVSVAVAFADSSIVVLALPDLYGAFDASIVGVSWVITSYNLVVAIAAFCLLPVISRVDVENIARVGLVVFTAASVGCAAAWTLPALIVFRCVQGLGGALLLAAALPLLGAITGSQSRGARIWVATATFGAALGPALGGLLTQLFDWRSIFIFQAPVAAVALLATVGPHVERLQRDERVKRKPGAMAADICLGFVFGALAGVLFLCVLLVITVWGLEPIVGALVVSALPVAALAVRPLVAALEPRLAIAGGVLLLAAGLVALALLPRVSSAFVALALAFCGVGLGLAVPVLTQLAIDPERAPARSGTLTIGARHAGLVLALALIAPLLTSALEDGGERALMAGTRTILGGDVSVFKKVPIALDLRDALENAPKGEVPDLSKPFNDRGAEPGNSLGRLRDELIVTLEAAITRSFRSSFALSALFAVLALVPWLWLRRLPQ
jgi:predicted MFS family arabinose efflux permease